jgi:hypothetical protein
MAASSLVVHFAALVEAVGEFLAYFWPISAAALIVAALSLSIRAPFRDSRFRKLLPLLAAVYAMPMVILLGGTLLRYDGPPHPRWQEPPAWRAYLLWGLVGVQVLLVLVGIARGTSVRLRAAGALLPSIWLSLCSVYPAIFSVVGVAP